jgi:chromosome segregation ATPase
MTDITQEKYEELQKQYDELKIKFKRQKQRIRNVNRNKYNLSREDAAKSNVIKEFRKKSNNKICELNNKITEINDEKENLQEECIHWREDRNYTYQKFIASMGVAISSIFGWYFILRGIENCICE